MAGHTLRCRSRAGDQHCHTRCNRRKSRLHQAGYTRRCFAQRLATRPPRSRRPTPAKALPARTARRPLPTRGKAKQVEACVWGLAIARRVLFLLSRISTLWLVDHYFFDLRPLSRDTEPLPVCDTARRRPRRMARAHSMSLSASRVSRSNSRGSLWRAALCNASTAALRRSSASSSADRRLQSFMALDRVISACWISRFHGSGLDPLAVQMSDLCGLSRTPRSTLDCI
jgi:hypothetical protein